MIEIGPGALDNNGKLIPLAVNIGDRVLLPEYGGQKVKINDQELYIYRDSEIVGKLE